MAKKKTAKKTAKKAVKKTAKRLSDDQIRALYEKIPQRHIAVLTGRQTKQLQDLDQRWGVEVDGRTTDLNVVLPQFCDALALVGRRNISLESLQRPDSNPDDDENLTVELQRERLKLLRARRMKEEGKLVPREIVHEEVARFAGILRGAGARIAKSDGGCEAQEILNEAIDELMGIMERDDETDI